MNILYVRHPVIICNNLSHIQAVLEVPKPYDRMLTIVAGQKWKDIRNTLTPTFSAHKMKQVGGPPRQKLTYFFFSNYKLGKK